MPDSIDELKYDLKVSINYHRKRERFYRLLDATSKACSLIALASTSFSVLNFTLWAAVISGLFTIATIVFDCSGMAARHAALAARFNAHLATAVLEEISPSTDIVKKLRHEYHKIEADEPTPLRGLVQLCQDEQDAADDRKGVKSEYLTLRRQVMAHFGFGWRPIDSQG